MKAIAVKAVTAYAPRMSPMADSPTDCSEALGVRHAVPADVAGLIELENASFSSDRLSPRQWRRHLASDRACILVIPAQRKMCAAAVVFFRSNSRIARLYSLAVSASARGRGLGERLLSACETESRQRGCSHLRLEVRADNMAALRLYDRRGYKLFGRHDGYYADGEDALRYETLLGQG
jgi:[ribosomal protein S18]-alanine N-acetyltransferase